MTDAKPDPLEELKRLLEHLSGQPGTQPIAWLRDCIAALEKERADIRIAVAQYRRSEGCSCCEGSRHSEDEDRLGALLGVPRYADDSGWDWDALDAELRGGA